MTCPETGPDAGFRSSNGAPEAVPPPPRPRRRPPRPLPVAGALPPRARPVGGRGQLVRDGRGRREGARGGRQVGGEGDRLDTVEPGAIPRRRDWYHPRSPAFAGDSDSL